MKLLLTSSGFTNTSITNALRELLGKDFKDTNLVFIPTAANVETGGKEWLIDDFIACKKLGFKEIDIVDIAAVPQEVWEPRLKNADIIMVGGGNTSYLMGQIKKSGLGTLLPDLLETRIYVGISAGSMVTAPKLQEKEMQMLYNEPIFDDETNEGLGFVDFLVVPHMNSPHFPRVAEQIDEVAKDTDVPFYALDDQSAVKVTDGNVEVVSEGKWKRFN
ncbi:Type 1 glutamine amidotransferase-like domain-containing protein [Candidatus Kaiserbacteria bacterium]|nr:Type 1 glutamine amidotransferase-like domain-containing protein [Candidatus Kaiserbacteria bacterium]